MKSSHRYFGVVVLILILATPMFAGDIHTMNPSPPPSAPVTAQGEISTGNADASGDLVTDAVLGLLRGVLSLL